LNFEENSVGLRLRFRRLQLQAVAAPGFAERGPVGRPLLKQRDDLPIRRLQWMRTSVYRAAVGQILNRGHRLPRPPYGGAASNYKPVLQTNIWLMNLPRKKDRLATLDWGSDPKLCKCRSVKDDSGRCRWQPPSRRWRWSNTIQRQHVASLHYYILTLKAGVVCILLVKLCDPHLSALEVRFSDEALYKSTFTFTYYISFWDLGRRDQTVVFQRGLGRRKVGCLGDFVPRRSKLRLYTGTIILTQFFLLSEECLY